VGHIAAGYSDELLNQRIASEQPLMQPRQHVAPQNAPITTKQTQPAICGCIGIQNINLGKGMRTARIRQQTAYAMIGLAAQNERSPIQPFALVTN
jgi:hypothetical protein